MTGMVITDGEELKRLRWIRKWWWLGWVFGVLMLALAFYFWAKLSERQALTQELRDASMTIAAVSAVADRVAQDQKTAAAALETTYQNQNALAQMTITWAEYLRGKEEALGIKSWPPAVVQRGQRKGQ